MIKFGGPDPRFGPRVPIAVRQNMRKPKNLLSEAQAQEISRRLKAGEKARDLAAEFGVVSSVVTRIIKGAWRPWHESRRQLTGEEARDVRERRRAGETLESIAQSHGVTAGTISSLALGKTYQDIESAAVGRSKPGRKRRFSDEQIAEMRRRYGDGESHTLIARDYGVTSGFIHALAAQRTYRDVA